MKRMFDKCKGLLEILSQAQDDDGAFLSHSELGSESLTSRDEKADKRSRKRTGAEGVRGKLMKFGPCPLHARSKNEFGMTAGFTLAEVLITLAIIGVVAALTIPSVISNSQQQEFKTGLRKAVSVLNSAITMNMALDGESPYDNANLFAYLQKHMSVLESTLNLNGKYTTMSDYGGAYTNAAFYTTDGMRFEFRADNVRMNSIPLYENGSILLCTTSALSGIKQYENKTSCNGCGSYGLNSNTDKTTKPPCLITVDVNGDRKPSPNNVNCKNDTCARTNIYKIADPLGKKLTDIFSIMITDKQAIPYGVAAQKAMYQAQK